MKKSILPIVLVLIPLILSAGIMTSIRKFKDGIPLMNTRGWRLSQMVESDWVDEEWENYNRVINTFDGNHPNRITRMNLEEWEPDTASWQTYAIAELEYNAAGRITQNTINYCFGEIIYPLAKILAEYDAQNRMTRFSMLSADFPVAKDPDMWILKSEIDIVYGPNNTLEVWYWNNPDEYGDFAYGHPVFEYDSRPRIIQETEYFSADSLNWVQDYQHATQYHPQDTSTVASFIEYLSANMPLIFFYEDMDEPALITMRTSSYWEEDEGWVLDSRDVLEYNDALQRTSKTNNYYDHSTQTWHPSDRWLYYYQANGLKDHTIYQYMYWGGEYENATYQQYIWETYTDNADEHLTPLPNLLVKAYPSPFTDQLTIKIDSEKSSPVAVKVYNLRGQEVRTLSGLETIWDGRDAQGRALSPGIYFIRATQEGRSSTKKVIKL